MLTIDKMFECDFGLDYSGEHRSLQEIARKLRAVRENSNTELHKEDQQTEQSFWFSLIKEDIMNEVQK